ncbi:HMG box protein [Schizosaccharomyces octosporus yFS286]|uniref:HMG box protein n=1 Tax=Schizosaccharomyces octosporus (strain yFS286) TaxID=483514 RepID=S9PSW1_SCHOY|nr:HMG box protein [Schizosaccharomyces octosporus yFS286]EPX72236.1 HMG box protein [Schizosaccharomyces octosporus yFS286]
MAEEHGNLQKLSNSVSKLEDAFKLALGACQDIKEFLPILIAEKGAAGKPQGKTDKNEKLEKPKQTTNKESATSTTKNADVEGSVAPASAVPATSSVEPVASASPTPSKRKARDPAQPKRPPTAYNLFQKNQRSEIKDSLGEKGNDVKEVNKAMHEKWTSLNENERKPFEDEAAKLRETYDAEMTAFQASRESASSPAPVPVAAAEAESQGNQVAVSMPTTPANKDYVEFSETRPLAQASLSSPVTTSKKQNKKKRSSTNAPVEPQLQQEEGSAAADKTEANPSPSVAKRDKKKRRKSSVNTNNAPTATAASN